MNSNLESKVFIWHPTTGIKETDLPEELIYLNAINDKGQLIGSIDIRNKRHYTSHAFIFSFDLGFIDLGVLPKGRVSSAYAINNKGQVVGTSETKDDEKAFIWDIDHGMRDLNDLIPKNDGWINLSTAKAINDSGYILGEGNYYGTDKNFLLIPKN